MPRTIRLSKKERDAIKADAERKVDMLTSEEAEILASKLNERVNIPFFEEQTEQIVLVKIVKLIDRALYKVLPNELYALAKSAADGITAQEALEIETRLIEWANRKIDIPFLSEELEEKILRNVIELITGALRKGLSIRKLGQ